MGFFIYQYYSDNVSGGNSSSSISSSSALVNDTEANSYGSAPSGPPPGKVLTSPSPITHNLHTRERRGATRATQFHTASHALHAIAVAARKCTDGAVVVPREGDWDGDGVAEGEKR